jgi:hypothetical protein
MSEFVNIEYEWDPQEERNYSEVLTKMGTEPVLNVNFKDTSEYGLLNFSVEGPKESLEAALDELFTQSVEKPVKITVDRHSFVCDALAHIHPSFRSSTREGHKVALDLLKKKNAQIKKGIYIGCASCNIAKF